MLSRSVATLSIAAMGLGSLAVPPALADTAPAVRVNELHYDNASSDVGEFVEVAGPAGTDLTGWSVVLYNGANGTPYDTVALEGSIDDEEGGFGAVSVARAGIQNGSPDGLALVDADGGVVELLSYEGAFTAVGGPADGMTTTDIGVAEASSAPVGSSLGLTGAPGAADATWTSYADDSPGELNPGQRAEPEPEPDPLSCDQTAFTPIHDVQGPGTATPMAGRTVDIEGIVVGDFQRYGSLSGFFVQEQDDEHDDDPMSSEGVFVYGWWDGVDVGDRVVVRGTATEYRDLTELTDTETLVCGTGAVTPTDLALPRTTAEREAVEGMLVDASDLTVTEVYFAARYGELRLAEGGRLWQPTELFAPGSPEAAQLAAENVARSILLDDASTRQNPDPVPYVTDRVVRVGDTVTELRAVMHEAFGEHRLQPITDPAFASTNPRTAAPAPVGGDVRVASFNVLNYFNGPDFPTARGADSPEEFARQRAKIVAAITALDADIVGLMEIENDGYGPDSAIADLVAGLNEAAGRDVWRFVRPATDRLGDDQIAVGMLYRHARVQVNGHPAVLDSSVDPAFDDTKNRPVLAATFNHRGEKLTVAVNHLKSKGSSCAAIGDPDDPEQGSCNGIRTAAAEAEARWLASDPTGFATDHVLVIGDLNAYAQEDPLAAFAEGGFRDLLPSSVEAPRYSYVFDGRSGSLDHALATASLAGRVTGATVWHVNADEPSAYDYDLSYGRPPYLWEPTPYRSSDHDPVVVGVRLGGPPR